MLFIDGPSSFADHATQLECNCVSDCARILVHSSSVDTLRPTDWFEKQRPQEANRTSRALHPPSVCRQLPPASPWVRRATERQRGRTRLWLDHYERWRSGKPASRPAAVTPALLRVLRCRSRRLPFYTHARLRRTFLWMQSSLRFFHVGAAALRVLDAKVL